MNDDDGQESFLDDNNEIIVRARAGDPDTSKEAATLITAKQTRLRESIRVVLAILEEYGPSTDFDIRSHWPEYWPDAWSEGLPRMARLWAEREDKVETCGLGIHKGRKCRIWRLKKPDEWEERHEAFTNEGEDRNEEEIDDRN